MKKKKMFIIIGSIAVILLVGYVIVWLVTPFPIHYAAERGSLFKIKQALQRGVDINLRTSKGNTPLHSATFLGHYNVVEYLLREGADINAKDESGETPLIWSAKSPLCESKITRLLLKHGARLNDENNDGQTALYFYLILRARSLLEEDERDVVYELVRDFFEHGAEFVGIMSSDLGSHMIFESPLENGYFRIATLLVENGILDFFDDPSDGMSLALQAWEDVNTTDHYEFISKLNNDDSGILKKHEDLKRCKELIKSIYDKKMASSGLDDEERELLSRIIADRNNNKESEL